MLNSRYCQSLAKRQYSERIMVGAPNLGIIHLLKVSIVVTLCFVENVSSFKLNIINPCEGTLTPISKSSSDGSKTCKLKQEKENCGKDCCKKLACDLDGNVIFHKAGNNLCLAKYCTAADIKDIKHGSYEVYRVGAIPQSAPADRGNAVGGVQTPAWAIALTVIGSALFIGFVILGYKHYQKIHHERLHTDLGFSVGPTLVDAERNRALSSVSQYYDKKP